MDGWVDILLTGFSTGTRNQGTKQAKYPSIQIFAQSAPPQYRDHLCIQDPCTNIRILGNDGRRSNMEKERKIKTPSSSLIPFSRHSYPSTNDSQSMYKQRYGSSSMNERMNQ
eukprot:scaffold4979_cov73-Cylindrotheca_fusiformis.AAC.12